VDFRARENPLASAEFRTPDRLARCYHTELVLLCENLCMSGRERLAEARVTVQSVLGMRVLFNPVCVRACIERGFGHCRNFLRQV
jgi:hypothetical protein